MSTTIPAMPTRRQCCHIKHLALGHRNCHIPAKLERGGKWYCGIHDPDKKAARAAKRDERWDREAKVRSLRQSADDLVLELIDMVAEQEQSTTAREIARDIRHKRETADELEKQR